MTEYNYCSSIAEYVLPEEVRLVLLRAADKEQHPAEEPERVLVSSCTIDCGGKCPLNVHVSNGAITRISTHDDGKIPPIKACVRGLNYHYRVYAPDRLKYPMKRVGERGSGRFRRISWDEALDTLSSELQRIKATYGPEAIFECAYSGCHICLLHETFAGGSTYRLMNHFGGRTAFGTQTSGESAWRAARFSFGVVNRDSSSFSDLVNSKLIILWGYNFVETHMGTQSLYWFTQARDKGIKFIYIDPTYTDTAKYTKAEWIPIRPSTDTAMLISMAYVLINENLYDKKFVDRYVYGFDKYIDYVMGVIDNIPKTPEWAASITGVPADVITRLAREYASAKPAALIPAYGPGRSANGEQFHRSTIALQVMTGNVGIKGGSTHCTNTEAHRIGMAQMIWPMLMSEGSRLTFGGKGVEIKTGHWAEAVLKGKSGGYPSDIKMIYVVGHNILTSRANVKKGVEAFKNVEFVACQDQFFTPTARYADILLPANTNFERNDIALPWLRGDYVIFANKVVEPLWDSKSDFDITNELAKRLGIDDFDNRTEDEWLRGFFDQFELGRSDIEEPITYEEFKKRGLYRFGGEPHIAFKNEIEDPEHNPFPTPSGKIEIFSRVLDEMNFNTEEYSSVYPTFRDIPRIPTFIDCGELPISPKAKQYPLQLTTPHSPYRAHSQFFNIPKLRQMYRHEAWINDKDAYTRNIRDGDIVHVFNDRGVIQIYAKVTDRIMPGVVRCYHSGWYDPDERGIDRGGCGNVLLDDMLTSPGAASNCNTCLVDVKRAE